MSASRRRVLTAIPLTIGFSGCSSLQMNATQNVAIIIFNVSGTVQPLEYTLTRSDEQFASGSLDVAETPEGDHYTLEADFGQIDRGDELRLIVSLAEGSEKESTNLEATCTRQCENRFTIRITEQSGLELYGRSSSNK